MLGDCAHAFHLVVQDLVTVPCCVEVFEAAGLIATKFKNTRMKQFLKKYSGINPNQRIGIIFLTFFSYCQAIPLAGATW
jgi:hypothetical protein